MASRPRRASPGSRRTAVTGSALLRLRHSISPDENAIIDGPPSPLTTRALASLTHRLSDPADRTYDWTQTIEQPDIPDDVAEIVPIEVVEDGGGSDRPFPKRTEEEERAIDDLLDHLEFDKTLSLAVLDNLNKFPKKHIDILASLATSILERADTDRLFLVRRSMALFVNGNGSDPPRLQWSPLTWLSILVDQYFEGEASNGIVLRTYAGFYAPIGHHEAIHATDIASDLWAQLLVHERCIVTVEPEMLRETSHLWDFDFFFDQLRKSVLQQLQYTPILIVFDGTERVYDCHKMDKLIGELVLLVEKDCRYPLRILVTNWTRSWVKLPGLQGTLKVIDVSDEEMEAFRDAVRSV